ncbi:MAG: CDP-diacylglycerol--glycerol-3-phosphate 3-phosphatidyltransferase [Spiroplasma sp.]
MNVANSISLVRILLVPIIVILMLVNWNDIVIVINNYHLAISWLIAGIFFIIAALSDFLDGYLARKMNQVTTFGKFFDSIADKFLTSAILIVMSYKQILPIWITLILILRDFLIDALRQILASKHVIMTANWYGKWKAASLMVGLTLLFFINYQSFKGNSSGNGLYDQYGLIHQLILIPTYFAIFLSVYSAGVYFYLNSHYFFNDSKNDLKKTKKNNKKKK